MLKEFGGPKTDPKPDGADADREGFIAAVVAAAETACLRGGKTAMNDGTGLEEISKLVVTFKQWTKDSPGKLRGLFQDRAVQDALARIGLQVTVLELHAARSGARDAFGLGSTLCGINGRRHATLVTCKRCLTRLHNDGAGKA